MNERDHAVVVGITRYPALGDLDAPVRDAKAIRAWLVDPKGGGLRVKNVARIISEPSSRPQRPYEAQPNDGKVKEAFEEILYRADREPRDAEGYFGRRLYIYMAGHGLSFSMSQGALYTANATPRIGNHVLATAWFQSFVDQGLFREYVLWLDFCMDRRIGLPPQTIPLKEVALSPAPGYVSFLGFACPPSSRTVETEIAQDRNRMHGVFTWTLLQGLKGAARKPGEAITGKSLYEHLMHSMKDYLKPEHRSNGLISDLPDIPLWSSEIVFVQAPSPTQAGGVSEPVYPVTFTFPSGATGKEARIWSGNPPAAQSLRVTARKLDVELKAGLHVIELSAARLRHPFEVTGSGPVAVNIDEPGEAVREPPPGKTFALSVQPGPETSEIVIVDNLFSRYAATKGNTFWQRSIPFGLYKVQAKVGSLLNECIVLLDRDEPPVNLQAPAVPSPAPLQGSAFVHEYHMAAIDGLSRKPPHVTAGQGAQIFLMARVWSPQGSSPGSEPWFGIQLLDDQGRVIADLARDGDRETGGDPVASCLVAVSPGTYYLRERLADGRQIEQSLIACGDWRLEVYILRSNDSGGAGVRAVRGGAGVSTTRQVSLLMNSLHAERRPDLERQLESARLALADGRRVLSDELKQLFMVKFDNPVAGLLGAHLLLVEAEKAKEGEEPDLGLLNVVVPNLRQLLGNRHPDVEAISLSCPDRNLRAKRGLVAPPMFSGSWRLVVEASQQRSSLVPLTLAQRVGVLCGLDPYLVWWSDKPTRRAYAKQLLSWRDSLIEQVPRPRRARPLPRPREAAMPPTAVLYEMQPDVGERRAALRRSTRSGAYRLPAGAGRALAGDTDVQKPRRPAAPTREAKLQAAQMQIPAAVLKEIWQS